VLVDSVLKSAYFLNIYCGKNLEDEVRVEISCREASAAYRIVMNLLQDFEEKWPL
jgi:hypothetical protein